MRTQETPISRYLKEVFGYKEDLVLKSIREHSEKENVAYMQISSYEGGILQFLCQALKVKKVVEIGTLYGYSSLMIARTLPEGGQLWTLDLSEKRQKKAQELMQADPAGAKVCFKAGPALESLKSLEDQAPFDMVFIDADKGGYRDYLHWSYKNLKPGGLVVADNTFLFGAVYGEPKEQQPEKTVEVMRAFNKELASSGLYVSTLIPTAEGLTVGIKK